MGQLRAESHIDVQQGQLRTAAGELPRKLRCFRSLEIFGTLPDCALMSCFRPPGSGLPAALLSHRSSVGTPRQGIYLTWVEHRLSEIVGSALCVLQLLPLFNLLWLWGFGPAVVPFIVCIAPRSPFTCWCSMLHRSDSCLDFELGFPNIGALIVALY